MEEFKKEFTNKEAEPLYTLYFEKTLSGQSSSDFTMLSFMKNKILKFSPNII